MGAVDVDNLTKKEDLGEGLRLCPSSAIMAKDGAAVRRWPSMSQSSCSSTYVCHDILLPPRRAGGITAAARSLVRGGGIREKVRVETVKSAGSCLDWRPSIGLSLRP